VKSPPELTSRPCYVAACPRRPPLLLRPMKKASVTNFQQRKWRWWPLAVLLVRASFSAQERLWKSLARLPSLAS